MSTGFLILFMIGTSAALGLCVAYLVRHRRAERALGEAAARTSPPPPERLEPPADNGFDDLAIPRIPMYQETREAMTALRSRLDQFNAILEEILVAGGTPFRPTAQAMEAFRLDLPRLESALVDARGQAQAILDKVTNRAPSVQPITETGLENQPITISPSPRREPTEAYMARMLSLLRETYSETKPCIAGFYYALTSHDEHPRLTEASTQIELLILSLDNALTRIAELDRTLKRRALARDSARPGASS